MQHLKNQNFATMRIFSQLFPNRHPEHNEKEQTTNLTQGNGTKLYEHNTEGKISGQNERAKGRGQKEGKGKGKGKTTNCYLPLVCVGIINHVVDF